MTGAMQAVELGCLPGICGISKSLVYEDFRTACQRKGWGLLNSCRGRYKVSAFTAGWGGGGVVRAGPDTLLPPWPLSPLFWILSLSLCRQSCFIKLKGWRSRCVHWHRKDKGLPGSYKSPYTKAWGCSAFGCITLQAWSHLPVEGKWPELWPGALAVCLAAM